jgi:citrate synthase
MSTSNLQSLVDQATQLINQINTISSFDMVRQWDNTASDVSGQIKYEIEQLEERLSQVVTPEPVEEKKGFFSRFTNKTPKGPSESDNLRDVISKLQFISNTLEEWIDRTPDTVDEAKSMIADYKLLKKELLLEKREATTNLRDAREQSRNNMASMTTLRGGVGRFARDYERLRKENELSKHQSQRDQIESQLISVEKRIIWLEKISRS